MKAKFDFYEIVKVISKNRLKDIYGMEVVITGRSENENNEWCYAINANDEGWSAFE